MASGIWINSAWQPGEPTMTPGQNISSWEREGLVLPWFALHWDSLTRHQAIRECLNESHEDGEGSEGETIWGHFCYVQPGSEETEGRTHYGLQYKIPSAKYREYLYDKNLTQQQS